MDAKYKNNKVVWYGDRGSPSSDVVNLAEDNPKRKAGRKKFKETRHPVYRGIRQRNSGKWVGELREPNKKTRIWLGTFQTAEMAARAYDVAVIALRGRSACLNFADSVSLAVPDTGVTKDIQVAAAEAAEKFRPREGGGASFSEEVIGDEFAVDEDVFGMQEMLADMYSGMMLPPPYEAADRVEYQELDYNLWSY